ncbi:MAG: PrsW family intramembrane metalloprotease, partial [Chloroflexi bacterium]|nr:PrsW family intramembrane metalloprotease [Chloroflexota bacterium]
GHHYIEPSYREHVSGPLHQTGPGTTPARSRQQPPASPLLDYDAIPQPLAGASDNKAVLSTTNSGNAAPSSNNNSNDPAYTRPDFYKQPKQPKQSGQQAYYPYQQYPYQYPQQPQGYYPQGQYPQHAQGYYPQGQYWNGYYYPYYGYYGNYYNRYAPYYYGGYQQPKPKGSTYQRVIAVIATICSGLALLTGLLCAGLLFLTLFSIALMHNIPSAKMGSLFSGITMFTALTIAGLGGGSFGLYHSICALVRRTSIEFKLPSLRIKLSDVKLKTPWFVIFLALYIVMIAIGLMVRGDNAVATDTGLTVLLIMLAGLLPAMAVMTLGAWRVHNPRDEHWPTTWRRFAMALISGATSAIIFAMILEAILEVIVVMNFHNAFQLSDPNAPLPKDLGSIVVMLIILSVIAPLVEEGVKPLAVVTMIGRIGSAAEAFTLGMACGIGFDLIETSSYIGMGYSNWVDVAIERSSAGLLHSFGAGMTALGWYLLTHRDSLPKKRVLIALGCFLYAILQHATWNGSFLFSYLPDPIGSYIQQGTITIGTYQMPAELIIYAIETVLMLTFFWFVTGKLSGRSRKPKQPQTVQETAPHNVPTGNLPGPREPYPQPTR